MVAAIIIIAIILGFVAIKNSASKKGKLVLYDLKEELGFEGGQVLEYGVLTGNVVTEDFVERYSTYASDENRQLYFVFGNQEEITIATFEEILLGEVNIVIGDSEPKTLVEGRVYVERTSSPGEGEDTVIVTIEDFSYEFELKEGENFYFIISQDIDGERHIIQS